MTVLGCAGALTFLTAPSQNASQQPFGMWFNSRSLARSRNRRGAFIAVSWRLTIRKRNLPRTVWKRGDRCSFYGAVLLQRHFIRASSTYSNRSILAWRGLQVSDALQQENLLPRPSYDR